MIAENNRLVESLEQRAFANELRTVRVVEKNVSRSQSEGIHDRRINGDARQRGPVETAGASDVVHSKLDDSSRVAFTGCKAGLRLANEIAESSPTPSSRKSPGLLRGTTRHLSNLSFRFTAARSNTTGSKRRPAHCSRSPCSG